MYKKFVNVHFYELIKIAYILLIYHAFSKEIAWFFCVNFNEPRKGERDYVFYLYNSNIAKKMDIDEDRFLSFKD